MNHTEYVDALKHSMENSINNENYFEAITIEFALLEDRVSSLLLKLDLEDSDKLYIKSSLLAEFMNSNEQDEYSEIRNLLIRRLADSSQGLPIIKKTNHYKSHVDYRKCYDLLSVFRVRRNALVHRMGHYTKGMSFEEILIEAKEIAILGRELVHKFSNLNNKVKKRIDKVEELE